MVTWFYGNYRLPEKSTVSYAQIGIKPMAGTVVVYETRTLQHRVALNYFY